MQSNTDMEPNNCDFGQEHFWNDPQLRCIDEIPPPFRQIFSKYRTFNVLQSQVFDEVFYTDNPLVISAPTGSGKTVVFELAITRLLTNVKFNNADPSFKVIYVAPLKALCEERMLDWHARFNEFGINCISVTGDSDIVDCQSLMSHNLIITTPEKWDAITRKWRDNKNLVEAVTLFMIDEVHLLNEDTRGPTLEAVVSRMKIVQSYVGAARKIRFVALSATIPNAEDITEWLDQCSINPAKCFKFSDEIRPVQLTKVVLGYPFNPLHSTPFKFDIMLNYKLHPVMLKYAQGKPVLIFCSTRKSVEMTAKHLMLNITIDLTAAQKRVLAETATAVSDGNVRSLLVHGIACHHAGMLPENRRAVEGLFRRGHLPVLVATSTLAMGVNLPAHLVIVKTTKQYVNGEYKSYSESAILQMIGRAGRPGFDTAAFAVIMTTAEDKKKYEDMVSGSQLVESNFHLHLTEHLNSEVVLGTISDLTVAMEWLTSTFLYVRAKKHPKHYGLPSGLTSDQLDKRLLEMCQIEINKLEKARMLTIDETTAITPTLLGYLMAKYYLAFDTMKLFTEINGTEILPQMLNLISNCKEFSDLYLRVNDKKALNLLNKCKNKETIRFPLNGRIKSLSMKINCLIQAVFGSLEVVEHSLQNDAQKIMRSGERIAKCLLDYLESPDFIQAHPKAYSALFSANILAKCFHTRLWDNSKHVAQQLPGIGVVLSGQLVAAGKTTFDAILEANPRDLERLLGRKPPQGNNIQDVVAHLPRYILQMVHEKTENGVAIIRFTIVLTNAAEIEEKCTVDKNSYMVLLVGDSFNNVYYYEKYSHDYMVQHGEMQKTFKSCNPQKHEVYVHFISQTWVGIDCSEKLVLNAKQEPKDKTDKAIKNKKTAPPKTNKTVEEVPKKPPITIQQFLDAYMKKTKPISKRNSPSNAEQHSTPPRAVEKAVAEEIPEIQNKCGSNNVLDSNNEVSDIDTDSLEENAKIVETMSKDDDKNKALILTYNEKETEDDHEINEQEASKIVFDIMDEQYDVIPEMITSENISKSFTNTTNCSNIQTEINTDNNGKKQNDSTKYLFELIFKDDEKSNVARDKNRSVQLQPDSTSCDHEINKKTVHQPEIAFFHEEQEMRPMKDKNSNGNQKSITWRSPLIISPASNYFVKDNVEPEPERITQRENEPKPPSPAFSVKFLDNSYSPPVAKTFPYTQQSQKAAVRKKSCKIQLADKNYSTQPQPIQDFNYDSIKVINTKRSKYNRTLSPLSDRSDLSASTSTMPLNEQKSEAETKEYRLKHFLSQFKKDEKRKMTLNDSSSQTTAIKWNLKDIENYEQQPSCSKWSNVETEIPKDFFESSPPSNVLPKRHTPNYAELCEGNKLQSPYSKWRKDYYVYEPPPLNRETSKNCFKSSPPTNILPEQHTLNYTQLNDNYDHQPSYSELGEYQPQDYYVYKSPPLKRKTPEEFFDSSSYWNKENDLQTAHSPNFAELSSVPEFEVDSLYSRHPRNYMAASTTNIAVTPRKHFTETRPFRNFSNISILPIPERPCRFTPHEENYFNQYTQPQHWQYNTHNQYYSQGPVQRLKPERLVAPRQCAHCNYCQAAPMMHQETACPYLHCEPEDPF